MISAGPSGRPSAARAGAAAVEIEGAGRLALLAAMACLGRARAARALRGELTRLDPGELGHLVDRLIAEKTLPFAAAAAGPRLFAALPATGRAKAEKAWEIGALTVEVFGRETRRILETLAAARVRGLVLRGVDFAENLWPFRSRLMADIDLLVREADVKRASVALRQCGFRQRALDLVTGALIPVSATEIARVQRGHYELAPFRKVVVEDSLHGSAVREVSRLLRASPGIFPRRPPRLVVQVDLHFNVGFGLRPEDVWRRPRAITVGGAPARGLGPEVLVWFLASRCYEEVMLVGRRNLRMFLDVLAAVARYGPRLHWREVTALGRRYRLAANLYYVLCRVRQLLGEDHVPGAVLEALRPDRPGAGRTGDFGDFVPRLFGGVHPCPVRWPAGLSG